MNISIIFAIASILGASAVTWLLLVLMADEAQAVITRQNVHGYLLTVAGLVMVALAFLTATNDYEFLIKSTQNWSGQMTVFLSTMSGVLLTYGGFIALPDNFTDKLLRQKYMLLYGPVAVVLAVLFLVI